MDLSNFFRDFFKNKKMLLVVGLVLLGIILALSSSGKESQAAPDVESLEEYKTRLEGELAEVCGSIKGVGKCRVTLTFSRGVESSYKGSLLIETKPPEVLGVAVVCRGADSPSVRAELTRLFTSLFDIPSTRVAILKLN